MKTQRNKTFFSVRETKGPFLFLSFKSAVGAFFFALFLLTCLAVTGCGQKGAYPKLGKVPDRSSPPFSVSEAQKEITELKATLQETASPSRI